MDLTAWLLRHTPPRPLLVAAPGGTAARVAAERAFRGRAWMAAASPAEANLLVLAGPLTDDLRPYLDRVWDNLPAPRAWAHVPHADPVGLERVLDTARSALRDPDQQRREAHDAVTSREGAAPGTVRGDGGDDASEHNGEHSGHDGHSEHGESGGHGNHGHHGHGGHDMGGMELPGGVPMAGRDSDRDGLMLDVLHVPLGPVLPDWPQGLIVHTTLQGDVVTDVSLEVVGAPGADSGGGGHSGVWTHHPRARAADSCARLLAVAGWDDAATTARRLRDELLDASDGSGGGHTALPRDTAAWARRVRRSRVLRWSLAGIGETPEDTAPPAHLRGDTLDRLHRWLDVVEHGPGPETGAADPAGTRWILDTLPGLLTGAELAVARLTVAGLDPDPGHAARPEGAHRG